MRHVVSILIENEAGALSRVVGLFSQRGYNIESLTVATTDDSTLSRCTILTEGSKEEAEQITKQLHKLVCVYRVCAVNEEAEGGLEREMLLLKIATPNRSVRDEVKTLTEIFGAKIIDVNAEIFTLEYVGSPSDIDNMLNTMKKLTEILEVVRSGVLGISKGSHCMRG